MPEIHSPVITLSSPLPPDVEAGTELALGVHVTCSFGCDLNGESVRALAPDGSVVTAEAMPHDEESNEAEILSLIAPVEVGEHTWTILVPAYEVDGVVHEEVSLRVGTTVRPHETSVAVWDLPTPVVIGERFGVKMGIRCCAECRLTGRLVEVRDEDGASVGEGSLGDKPWPGTRALYWVEVLLEAPPKEGSFTWSAGPVEADLGSWHVQASAVVGFCTVGPPEHTVAVAVVRDDTGDPIDKVEVRMGIYRASTDEQGMARFELPSGEFDLIAWKPGFAADPATVKVTGDLQVRIEARDVPDTDPDDERIWM
jgi:hypothetical protein